METCDKSEFVSTYNNNIPNSTSKRSYQLCMKTLMEAFTTKVCNENKAILNENREYDCISVFLINYVSSGLN